MDKRKGITVLWIDDRRNPLNYLKKKPEPGNMVLARNLAFYKRFIKKYEPNFVWVKSYNEFKEYITKNGLPDFVSFDRDLGNGPYNGEACASWLVDYCRENGLKLPDYYPHTANRKGRANIISIMKGNSMKINENDIKEAVKSALGMLMEYGVYADRRNINDKKKTIGITYNTTDSRNKGNALQNDSLKTDKMETDNGADTYNVKLKNGFECYNITSINGLNIMHYFKRKWDNKETKVGVKTEKGVEDYELKMKDAEWQKFLNRFKRKVGFVVDYHLSKLEKGNGAKINTISIYPVPSSSRFNEEMAKELQRTSLNGLGVQVIPPDILKKDLRNLEKDSDFIEKNKDFYSAKYSPDDSSRTTVGKKLDASMAKFRALTEFQKKTADELNQIVNEIRIKYFQLSFRNRGEAKNSLTTIKNMLILYVRYIMLIHQAKNLSYNLGGKNGRIYFTHDGEYKIIRPKTPKKGPSGLETLTKVSGMLFDWGKYLINNGQSDEKLAKKFSEIDFEIISDAIKKRKADKSNDYYLQFWEPVPFEIKNLSNGERMGVKGIYNPNNLTPEDAERIQMEVEKTKGTAVVVFDDNVSGGATLSDVCYQLSQLGMENIIPITFGQMPEKWTQGRITLTKPTDVNGQGFNFS